MQRTNYVFASDNIYYPLNVGGESVEEWVAGLPLANIGETCRLVFASLTAINSSEVAPSQRFKTLEILRSTLQYIANTLKPRFVGSALPFHEKGRRVASIVCEMQLHMARAYEITAQHLLTQVGPRHDTDILAAALHRSLYYYGQTLLATYQTYRHPEFSYWRQVYQLYAEAERKSLQGSPLKERLKGANSTNISTMFKHIILFSLADPLRLTQQEMAATYSFLEHAADLCEILTSMPDNEGSAFRLDLMTETPPTRLPVGDIELAESCRLLDTTKLTYSMRGLLGGIALDNSMASRIRRSAANKLPPRLMQRLLTSWGLLAKRGFSRMAYHSKARVAFGLSASHEASASDAVYNTRPPQAMANPCDIVNESAMGACLYWAGHPSPRVRIGELVTLFHHDAEPSNGGIGVVRWMHHPVGEGIFFGIQMLVPSASPVTLRLAGEPERDYLKSLLLPPLPQRETAYTLLTPALLYRPGDIVTVRGIEEQERRLRLIRAVESTQVYTRFEFEALSPIQENETTGKRVTRVSNDKFDSIWSAL